MLALAAIEADTCGGCGGSLAEHGSDKWGRPQHLYDVEKSRCWRCDALARAQNDAKDAANPQSLLWSVTTRPS